MMITLQNTISRQQQGFSLIEMMLAMLIGIIIMGGILSIYNNTRDVQRVSEDQLHLVSDARFAIETIAYDLRHAGIFGGNNYPSTIKCYKGDPLCPTPLATAAADCETRWYIDITVPIFGSEASNPYTTCPISSHLANTDVVVVRYADSNPVDTASLVASTAYVRGNYQGGELFIGTTQPVIEQNDGSSLTNNHLLVARAYYVSDFTDVAGDGLPSLRRVDLVAGPAIQDQLILPGVENLQIQYGVDTNRDKSVDQYVNADAVADWTKVYAARIWVLVRGRTVDNTVDTSATFTIAGNSVSFPDDGYRRLLMSSVVNLRNMDRVDELSVGGT